VVRIRHSGMLYASLSLLPSVLSTVPWTPQITHAFIIVPINDHSIIVHRMERLIWIFSFIKQENNPRKLLLSPLLTPLSFISVASFLHVIYHPLLTSSAHNSYRKARDNAPVMETLFSHRRLNTAKSADALAGRPSKCMQSSLWHTESIRSKESMC
jgi:hypothetical protein